MKDKSKKPYRSKKALTYHGRTGKPLIHTCHKGKKYIMVRQKGGGTKRLFLDRNGNVPRNQRGDKRN